jgi:hypothetical protein
MGRCPLDAALHFSLEKSAICCPLRVARSTRIRADWGQDWGQT